MEKITLQDLFPKDAKYSFLVGAGCSRDLPSNLPLGREMMNAIIDFTCEKSEVEKLKGLENLRFEQLVETIRDSYDPELKIIDYYGLCESPNAQHFFLADMIKKGHYVMTTNFDYLLEFALMLSGIRKKRVVPVITKEDFISNSDPKKLLEMKKYPVYKIHGSPQNITKKGKEKNTKDSLIATIAAFGTGKEGVSVFQLEPFKKPLFENISYDRMLVVVGYSGSDDFDIVPTLKQLPNLSHIIWIDHQSENDELNIESITSENEYDEEDKIFQILKEISEKGYQTKIYRIRGLTTKILSHISPIMVPKEVPIFNMDVQEWFMTCLSSPHPLFRYMIPLKIYDQLGMLNEAERCGKIILSEAEELQTNPNTSEIDKSISGLLIVTANLILGKIRHRNGHLPEAMEYFKKSLEISLETQGITINFLAEIINRISDVYIAQGQIDMGVGYYRVILDNSKYLEKYPPSSFVPLLTSISKLLKIKGDLDKALEFLTKAYHLDKEIGNLGGIAQELNQIGLIHKEKGNFEKSLEYHREAIKIHKELYAPDGIATNLHNIGALQLDMGDTDKAFQSFLETLEISKKYGYLELEASTLDHMGNLYFKTGKLENSQECFAGALKINELLGNKQNQIHIVSSLGHLEGEKHNFERELELYRRALSIAEDCQDKKLMGDCAMSIATYFSRRKQENNAIEYYKQSLVYFEEIHDQEKISVVTGVLAVLYKKLKLFDESINFFDQYISFLDETKDTEEIMLSLQNLGMIYQQKKDYQKTISYFKEALEISRRLKNEEKSSVSLFYIALSYHALKNLDLAFQNYEESLKYYETTDDFRLQVTILKAMGSILIINNQSSEGLKLFQKSFKILVKHGADSDEIENLKKTIELIKSRISGQN